MKRSCTHFVAWADILHEEEDFHQVEILHEEEDF
jgi:hypothetical protein